MDYYRDQHEEKNYTINFDDERLTSFRIDDFEKLYDAFHELFNAEKTWFFDEIQLIDGWERFVRRLNNEGHKVFITGSNATMLSAELGSRLTGRYIQSELFPFSFSEYLSFQKITLKENDFYSTQKSITIKKAFQEFVNDGGFPEYLQTKNHNYLKTLYENIMYRDVVARFGVRNIKSMAEMIHFLISNISKETSYSALKNNFGYSNPNTVKEQISFFENAYLLFTINKFDYSLKKQQANPKKIYCIDTGMANQVSFQFSDNYGRKLENIVFLELRRRSNQIFYHKEKHECDFLVTENKKVVEAIQVSVKMDDEKTRGREINGLLEAINQHDLNEGLIITDDQEETLVLEDKKIRLLPCWKWLLKYSGE
jgi:predicted AAA+ superfamily ATPase